MKFQLIPSIAYLCILPVLIALGIWQLNRAEEKKAVLILQERSQHTERLILTDNLSGNVDAILYKNVRSTGHYDIEHQYLLDNQVHERRVGYFVLTPFVLKNEKKAVLVNRGWVGLGKTRSDKPDIDISSEERSINGRINRFPSVGLKLKGAEIPTKTWPSIVQIVDNEVISQQLGYKLMPFQIELDRTEADGYIREWRTDSPMPPEKHVAYAVQWFLLAITLTILFVKYGRQK
ncbi:MAG: SURF1 family protein [Methylococcaceae bacterium]|nr:SURF1 family protein [Methylococcaceae bacterium]